MGDLAEQAQGYWFLALGLAELQPLQPFGQELEPASRSVASLCVYLSLSVYEMGINTLVCAHALHEEGALRIN